MPLYPMPGRWPRTREQCAEAFGYSGWAHAWVPEQESGEMRDVLGDLHLTAVTSPLYRRPAAFMQPASPSPGGLVFPSTPNYSIEYDAAADRFEAGGNPSALNLATSASLLAYACVKINPGSDGYIMGKVPGAANYWLLRNHDPDDWVSFLYSDSNGATRSMLMQVNHSADGQFHDFLGFINRGDSLIQLFSDLGQTATADLDGFVATTGSAVPFHLGASSAVIATTPHQVAFAAVATSNVSIMHTNALQVMRNIRRYSGRS